MDEKGKRSSVVQLVLNIIYSLTGIIIIGIGIAAWLMEAWRRMLVPCVFALAAVMCALHAADLIRNMPRGKKNWSGVFAAIAGIPAMMMLSALTYICLR